MLPEGIFHFALVPAVHHVDEIDHDEAAQVPQPQLARDFLRGLKIGVKRGFLDITAGGGAGGIDIDGEERLGVIDDQGAPGREADFPRKRGFDLAFDLVAREQGIAVLI